MTGETMPVNARSTAGRQGEAAARMRRNRMGLGGFLGEPPPSDEREKLYADDLANDGYVWNLTRVWAWCPEALVAVSDALRGVSKAVTMELNDRAVLTLAAASTIEDSYCSFAYGLTSSQTSGEPVAIDVLSGTEQHLTGRDAGLARWARKVAGNPNGIHQGDVDELRSLGLDDREILAVTVFVALRIAFSTVNDALGATPDAELVAQLPPSIRHAVSWGRRPSGSC
jgi:alkylhydroperoxidase family enzyme